MPGTLSIEISDAAMAGVRRRAAELGVTAEAFAAAAVDAAAGPGVIVQTPEPEDNGEFGFLKYAGVFDSGIPDLAERHD